MKGPTVLSVAWIILLVGVAVIYRGYTQSLTIDEAFTYHHFLNQSASVLFEKYEANYHLLPTWLMWMAVHKFGKSEAIIRLPSMVASLFYLGGIWVLCRRLMGDNWRFLLGLVFLTANPLLADYYSAARGYGPALAFFVWAYNDLLRHKLARAGVWMGLSVLCNFTFLIPVACTVLIYGAYRIWAGEKITALVWRLPLAFAVVAGPGLAIPFLYGSRGDFYYGSEELGNAFTTLIAPSLAYGSPATPGWVLVVQPLAFPALLLAILMATFAAIRKRALDSALPVGTLALSIAALIAAHYWAGVAYPWTRTGLYLVWLFQVSLVVAWAVDARGMGRMLGGACAILTGLFLWQFDTRYYFEFRDDAGVSRMMAAVRDRAAGERVCVGGSWRYEPTVNYYRLRYKLERVDEMKRTDVPRDGCRFYVLAKEDKDFVGRLGLQALWTDSVSGSVVAEALPAGR